MGDLFIYNEFGITPTKNFTAAGYDFYIPVITETDEMRATIFKAFAASYKTTVEKIEYIYNRLSFCVAAYLDEKLFNDNTSLNILHLYLSQNKYKMFTDFSMENFVQEKLIFDEKHMPGMKVNQGDYLLFNSGIKVKLQEDTAGIFFNKSGKGNEGFDIRACVVDEDYAGFVHMSCAYDKDRYTKLYCGDKLSQFVILPIVKTNIVEVDNDKFNELHSDSKRGSDGFGSSDVKH